MHKSYAYSGKCWAYPKKCWDAWWKAGEMQTGARWVRNPRYFLQNSWDDLLQDNTSATFLEAIHAEKAWLKERWSWPYQSSATGVCGRGNCKRLAERRYSKDSRSGPFPHKSSQTEFGESDSLLWQPVPDLLCAWGLQRHQTQAAAILMWSQPWVYFSDWRDFQESVKEFTL